MSPSGSAGATVELPAEIFDIQVNVPLIHQVVVAQQAAARQGTHSTKTRGDVRGGGRKPTARRAPAGPGRARSGRRSSPAVAWSHGPVPRSYEQQTPKKMKAAALRGALSDRARHGRVHVVDGFVDGDAAADPGRGDRAGVVIGVAPSASSVLVVAASSTTRSPGRACATLPACT